MAGSAFQIRTLVHTIPNSKIKDHERQREQHHELTEGNPNSLHGKPIKTKSSEEQKNRERQSGRFKEECPRVGMDHDQRQRKDPQDIRVRKINHPEII